MSTETIDSPTEKKIDNAEAASVFATHLQAISQIDGIVEATTRKFRRELVDFIDQTPEDVRSGPIVEVGTYTGGTSSLLALCAESLNMPLYLVDISRDFLKKTAENVRRVTSYPNIFYFVGSAADFSKHFLLTERPFLTFIDADHRQGAVQKDIQAFLEQEFLPKFMVFHDFNLRSIGPERTSLGVDRAIDSVLGECPKHFIGAHHEQETKPNHSGDF